MKKSELTQLTQIIEHLVGREIRKQLPSIIAEVFQNMMGKPVVMERQTYVQQPIREEIEGPVNMEDPDEFKASLRELFAGVTPVKKAQVERPTEQRPIKQIKQYTKDPKLNAVLNETISDLRQRESLVGAAAFQGGYSPAMAMVPGFNAGAVAGPGAMMTPKEEPSFSKNMPIMPSFGPANHTPVVLREGQESTHVPLAELPEGISALDIAKHVPMPGGVNQALTKNYSQMMKLIDQKKRGIA